MSSSIVTTLGIDLAAQPANTVACQIRWAGGIPKIEPVSLACDDQMLDALIADSDIVAIDAPFGWPRPFIEAIGSWKQEVWDNSFSATMRLRQTDLWVWKQIGKLPLSVSTDRIALPTMRAMCLFRRHGVDKKSGDGKFFEVYPTGSLIVWGASAKGYKGKEQEGLKRRKEIRKILQDGVGSVSEEYAESDDADN